jgi:hypothetical protein
MYSLYGLAQILRVVQSIFSGNVFRGGWHKF